MLLRLHKTSPVSDQKVDELGLCEKKVSSFSPVVHPKCQFLVDKYVVSTSHIIHDGLEVQILGIDLGDHFNYVLYSYLLFVFVSY